MNLDERHLLMALDAGAYCRIGDTGFGQVWNERRLLGTASARTVRRLRAAGFGKALAGANPRTARRLLVINQAGRDRLWGMK